MQRKEMKKSKALVLAILFAAISTNVAAAGGAKFAGVRLEDSAFREEKLPRNENLENIVIDQDYGESRPKVFSRDLNGDRVRDFIIRSNDSLCGTGGCGYTVVDGKSFVTLGEFAGTEPIISDSKVNGHALIMFFKYSTADKAMLEVWAFKKRKYAYLKSIKLTGKELVLQEKQFHRIN